VTSARAALTKGDTTAASDALGRLLTLDRHHPAVAGLVTQDCLLAGSAAEASRDETPMTSDSDVLAAASDDMDVKDYEPDEEEEKA